MTADAQAYGAVLADLEIRRVEIDAAIRALRSLMPQALSATIDDGLSGRKPKAGEGPFSDLSIADASVEVLKLSTRPMHVSEIASAITAGGLQINSEDPVNTVGSILSRRASKKGDVARGDRRGMWQLSHDDDEETEDAVSIDDIDLGGDDDLGLGLHDDI